MQQDTTPYAKFDTVSYPAGNVDPYAQQQQPMQDQQQYYYTNTAPAQPVYGYAQPVVASQSLSHQSSFVQPHYDADYTKKKNDDAALLFFIIGFFFPILWVILFFITRDKNKYTTKGKSLGNIGCGLWVACFCLSIVMTAIIIGVRVGLSTAK